MKERALWIDYLRSFVILTVVIHHAALSYTTYAHFNQEAYIFSSHPMVDARRWIGFDNLVYFNDIFFMSLLFLVSGFFVVSGLKRKGNRQYITDRFRRLFVPFIFGVTFIALLAYYPSYIYAHDNHNIFRHIVDFLTVEYWPPGPVWFLWVLFVFNLFFVWSYPYLRHFLERLGESLQPLFNKPALLIFLWFLVTWILYVPLRLIVGPDKWTGIGPFDFQISRILLYPGYFFLGTIVGTIPSERGLLSGKSTFVKTWPVFCVLALSTFLLLINIDKPLEKLVYAGSISNLSSNLIYCSIFTASCIFSCAAYLTTARAIFRKQSQFWDKITSNAFTIYLIHYVFIIWGQYALLNLAIPAIIKFIIVAPGSILLSILVSHFMHKSSAISKFL